MKILFCWPNQGSFGVKPIGTSILTALLKREGHEVDLFDTSFMDLGGNDYNEDLTNSGYFKPVQWPVDVSKKKVSLEDELVAKLEEFKPDVVAISALSDEIEVVYKIIKLINTDKYKCRIAVGNKVASNIKPFYAAMNGLKIFIGESSCKFIQWVNNLNKNQYEFCQYVEPDGYMKDLDSLPYLDWSNFDDRHFLKAFDGEVYRGGDHMIGWGCTNSCSYCINEYWRELHGGMKGCIRRYPPDRICDELQALTAAYDLNFWKFHDEDFLLKPVKYIEKLVQEYLLRVDLPFTCMTNAKSVTEHKVELLKNMGCVSVSMGIETGDPVMRMMLNRRETPQEIINAVKLLQDYGIRVSTFNMLGLPFESVDTINSTIRLNQMAGVKHPNVSLFMPLEGTRLYDLSVRYKFYDPSWPISTGKPSLKLPSISEGQLMWYYKNFHHLVTGS